VTNEQRAAHIRALLHERSVYEKRGNTHGVAEVNEELRKFGHEGAPEHRRAERRPSARTRKAEAR
jgi:hypothetical protein